VRSKCPGLVTTEVRMDTIDKNFYLLI